ncbi:MAG TPA: hypothetical protein VJM33_12690 [Microthrixaceae bacterium]|nr:hypothetical protein [Microthrixaceae bacterium]
MSDLTAAATVRPEDPEGRRLLDADVIELLRLVRGADSVELKVTVPSTARRSTVTALGIDPLDAQIRQVYFFDTPDLALNRAGVVARARRVQGKGDDSVVKLRPVDPADLDEKLRASPEFGVEVDVMPGGYVCSASMKASLPKAPVRSTLLEGKSIKKLFSKDQRTFFEAHAPSGVGLEDLAVLGPIFVLKVRIVPEGFDQRIVGELWLYPDGSQIVELSTKCPPADALTVGTATRDFLASKGVDLAAPQQTKTKTALEFFVNELKPA